ncbi:MAG: GGDEF domain-containing protein [Bacillota bacterium]
MAIDYTRTPQWLSGDLLTRWLVSVLVIPLAVFGSHMPFWQLAAGLGVYIGYTLFLTAYARKHPDLRRLSDAHEQLQEYAREKGRQAVTDGLTGLFNHTHLQERLEEELRRAERYDHHVSLVMLDIDQFKAYNDSFGHLQGNGVLKQVADTLRGAVRASDLVARYGGDEFAVILPETDTEEALAMAERIRERVDSLGIEVTPGDRIPVSLGVATFPQHGRTRTELVERADQALYRVKRQGRNRVVAWTA